jgi:hypothetical protein
LILLIELIHWYFFTSLIFQERESGFRTFNKSGDWVKNPPDFYGGRVLAPPYSAPLFSAIMKDSLFGSDPWDF